MKLPILSLSLLAAATAQAAIVYNVTWVGTLGGSLDRGYSVNNRGQVAGSSNGQAFVYDYATGTITAIGGATTNGYGINATGLVVGQSFSGSFSGFQYQAGTGPVNTLSGTFGAQAVNDSGMIVGSTSANEPFYYTGGTLNTFGLTNGVANGVNNSGQVVGARDVSGSNRAFLYDTATSTLTNLGTLGGNFSIAYDINDTGTIVGYSANGSSVPRAFRYSGGVMTSLGTLAGGSTDQSLARAINNSGQIVGYSNFGFGFAAFLYDAGVMTNLNSLIDPLLGITLRDAYGISDNGAIIARGTNERAYLLTPLDWVPESGGEVPEPSTAALALAGITALAAAARRRRA